MICFGMVTTARSRRYTGPALASFLRHTALGANDRLLLIDNDGDFEADDDLSPAERGRIEIIRRGPHGFAANVNYALAEAMKMRADLVFLNNDVIFTPDWLMPLLASDNAILLPLCNQQLPLVGEDFSLRVTMELEDYRGHEAALEAMARAHARDEKFKGRFSRLPHLSFYCFRLPRPVYAVTGMFDEGFGRGGGEDVDYRFRAVMAGFEVAIAMQSYLLHFRGKSTWNSGETPEETGARNAAYAAHFGEKWGDAAAYLFLPNPDCAALAERLGVTDALIKGDVRAVLKVLIAKGELKLPA